MTLDEKFRELEENPECIECGEQFETMDALFDHVSDECDLLTRALVYGVKGPESHTASK